MGTGSALADMGHNTTVPEQGEQSWPETVARVRHTSVTTAQVSVDAAGLGSSQEVKPVGQDQDQQGKRPSRDNKAQASSSQAKPGRFPTWLPRDLLTAARSKVTQLHHIKAGFENRQLKP